MKALPKLIAITDLSLLDETALLERAALLARAARPGALAVLLREPELAARPKLALGRALSEVLRGAEQALWVAGRLDLALLLEADGVHLGEHSVPALDARRLVGPARHLSRAVHADFSSALRTHRESLAGDLAATDALVLSPIMEARKGQSALGVAALSELRGLLDVAAPHLALYALGGVTSHNAASCQAAGACGVAAIGAALRGDVHELMRSLQVARA